MVTPTEMIEAEMDNLLANIAEDRKLIIGDLLVLEIHLNFKRSRPR